MRQTTFVETYSDLHCLLSFLQQSHQVFFEPSKPMEQFNQTINKQTQNTATFSLFFFNHRSFTELPAQNICTARYLSDSNQKNETLDYIFHYSLTDF